MQGRSMLYLSAGGVAGAGPRRGSLGRAVRALRGQPAAAVRVAEALAVLFADLHQQKQRHGVQPEGGPGLESREVLRFVALCRKTFRESCRLWSEICGWCEKGLR